MYIYIHNNLYKQLKVFNLIIHLLEEKNSIIFYCDWLIATATCQQGKQLCKSNYSGPSVIQTLLLLGNDKSVHCSDN